DVDLHASHINADELLAAYASCDGRSFFPTLTRLCIRAEPVLLRTLLLQILPVGVLRLLHMDVISPAGPQSLRPVFSALTQYVVPSLKELVIEDFTSAEDIDDISSILAGEYWFSMSLLRPLGKLRSLRRFTITVLVPPDLCDDELVPLVLAALHDASTPGGLFHRRHAIIRLGARGQGGSCGTAAPTIAAMGRVPRRTEKGCDPRRMEKGHNSVSSVR
ncbi:hypothetical protein B0H21DRAFT_844415, partial [Amylocystis lapponica]